MWDPGAAGTQPGPDPPGSVAFPDTGRAPKRGLGVAVLLRLLGMGTSAPLGACPPPTHAPTLTHWPPVPQASTFRTTQAAPVPCPVPLPVPAPGKGALANVIHGRLPAALTPTDPGHRRVGALPRWDVEMSAGRETLCLPATATATEDSPQAGARSHEQRSHLNLFPSWGS